MSFLHTTRRCTVRRVFAFRNLMLVAVVVVAGGGAAWNWLVVTPRYKPRLTSPNPECPVNWGRFEVRHRQPSGGYDHTKLLSEQVDTPRTAVFASGSALASYGISLPNAISDVPEFHDCQRVRLAGGGNVKYGAVMGVFAGEKLDSMPDTLFNEPQAVAEVFVPEPGIYKPLGISNTFNCVVVQHATGKDDWAAWMVPVTRETQCRYRFRMTQLRMEWKLTVVAIPPPKGLDSSYVPRVARWDWDTSNKKQVIGVRCGSHWCWLGDKEGMVPPPSMQSSATGVAQAMAAVPGYSDRQQLAEWDTEKKLHAGPNWGTVVPTPDLQQALYNGRPGTTKPMLDEQLANFTAQWKHVATVFMSPSAGSYAATLNFGDEGKPARIYLCRGNGFFDCRPTLPYIFIKRQCHGAKSDGVRWYAKIEQEGKRTKYYCVTYCQHLGMQIPAVTRWRWRVDDEGIWISCPEGCCETNAD